FTSSDALLSVGSAGIGTQPMDEHLCSDGDGQASFTVTTTGSVSTIGWEIETLFGFVPVVDGAYENVVFSGADTETLSISGVTTANNGWIFHAVLNTDETYSNNVV